MVTVTGFLALSACGSPSDADIDRGKSSTTIAEVTAPSTAEDGTPSPEDSEREADLAQLEAIAATCPEKQADMERYYEESGEVMDCAPFGEFMVAVAVAMEEQARLEQESEFEAAVKEAMDEEAREEREYVAAVKRELAVQDRQRTQQEYQEAIERAIREETAEAHRQGQALVDRMCGNRGGRYYYDISPVRVQLGRCNPGTTGGGSGGDVDCEDIGEEFEIDPYDDPHGLDGDGDGIACEGW